MDAAHLSQSGDAGGKVANLQAGGRHRNSAATYWHSGDRGHVSVVSILVDVAKMLARPPPRLRRLRHRLPSMDSPMNKQDVKKRSLVFFLVPNFSMLPFSAAIETLRIANRMLGYEAYTWRLASTDGQQVLSSSGIGIEVNSSLADERKHLGGENRPSMVLVCSGIYVEDFSNKSANAWLREVYNRGIAVGSLCTGAHVLA
jgi:hypothetical protein